MPRRARSIIGGYVYHVLNRANARHSLFDTPLDYAAFEKVIAEAHEREPLRILAYCIMPNHWHLVVWPEQQRYEQVSSFMAWLTGTHTQRWHANHQTAGTGHLYQGRFKAFPVETDEHLYCVLRYVERNALRARLVDRAEDWRWSSLWRRSRGEPTPWLANWPVPLPESWLTYVNQPETEAELAAIRACVNREVPYGRRPRR
jgi:putative transposase